MTSVVMRRPATYEDLKVPEHLVGRDILVPDIVGWRREKMPVFPDVRWLDLAPNWICEVVSPSTSYLDRVKKLPRYARYDITHAWIVDPKAKSLEVYERRGEIFGLLETFGKDDVVRAVPFDACEINLASLWLADEAQP